MPRHRCLAAALLLAILAAPGATRAQAPQGEPVTIGVIEDRSGGASYYSQESVRGMRLFVDMANAGRFLYAGATVGSTPGILGRPVRAIYEDDQNDPNQTVVKTRRLVSQGAQVIFFLSGSGSTLQGRVVCTEQKLLCMAPTNVSGRIVQAPNADFIFTIITPGELSNAAIAAAWQQAGYKRAAYVEGNSATSKLVGDGFRRALEAAGIATAATEQVESGARDMIAPLLHIRDAKPDVVLDLLQSASDEATLYLSRARLGGATPLWAINTITAQPQAWKLAGPAIDGLIAMDNITPDNRNTQALRAAFLEKYGADANFLFLHAGVWDALMLTKLAAERTGGLDGARLRDALEQVGDFPSSYGQPGYTLSFAPGRHAGGSMRGLVFVQFANQKPAVPLPQYQPK